MAGLADLLRNGAPNADETDVPDDLSELTGAPGDPVPAEADQLAPDPQPSRRGSGKGRRTRAAGTTSKGERDQVRDALTMLYSLPAWGVRLKDPHCGGALLDERDAIIKTLVPIVCRNPAMVAFLTGVDAPWMDYLALAQALSPVASTVWSHHVTHTIGAQPAEEGVSGGDFSAYAAPNYG